MICYYVSYLAKAGLQASPIKVYLAALHHTQIARTETELEHSKMPKLKILRVASEGNKHPYPSRVSLVFQSLWPS